MRERNDYVLNREEILAARAEGDLSTDAPDPLDQYEFYWKVFCLLTEGPHDAIDEDEFDAKLGERVFMDFLPQALVTQMQLSGALPSRVNL
jgi:hypothetical protein